MGAVIQEDEERKQQTLHLKTKSLASWHHHANLQIPKSSALWFLYLLSMYNSVSLTAA